MAERVLITGAGGFVGGHLARFLAGQGREIWASYHRRIKKFPFALHWIKADLTDLGETEALVRRSRPHYVFHFAGQAVPSESWKDPAGTLKVNVSASIHLLQAVARFRPDARVLLASSSHVYGRSFFEIRRVRETDPAVPVSPYGMSKLLMELAGLNFKKQHGLEVVIARSFNLVGTDQNPSYAFYDFCRQIARMEKGRQKPVLKVGNIDVVRDFVHARDAARAYVLLMKKGKKGEVYNVASGRGLLLRKAVGFLRKECGIPFKIASEGRRLRKNDLPVMGVNISKIRALGWRPRESVTQGLREILEEQREKAK